MIEFTDEHKKEYEGGKYFDFGVHTVTIMKVEFGLTEKDGKEYVEITVQDDPKADEPRETEVRLWFTNDKSIRYSLNTIKGIFSHNTPKEKREAVKKEVNKVSDTEELDKLMQKLVGKEAFIEVSEDEVRTFEDKDGNVRPSINRNIYGYKPEPKMVKAEPRVSSTNTDKSNASPDEDVMAGF